MSVPHPLPFKTVPSLHTLISAFPGIKTLLFDMDGTLFDTEKYHTLALQSIGREHGIVPPLGPKEVHELMMGKADHLLFDLVKDWPGFPAQWTARDFVNEKNRHLLEMLNQVSGDSYFSPLLRKLVNEIKDHGLNIALVTSSEKIITLKMLQLTHLEDSFDYVLTRDDSLKVKPDPWPYKTAIARFGSAVHETLIFEDSNVGIEAARLSGAHVVKAEWY